MSGSQDMNSFLPGDQTSAITFDGVHLKYMLYVCVCVCAYVCMHAYVLFNPV